MNKFITGARSIGSRCATSRWKAKRNSYTFMKKSEANSDCSIVEKSVEAFSIRFVFCVGLFSLGLGYVLTLGLACYLFE